MLQFVNGFSCAVDSEKKEFIINFVQRIPKIDDEGMQTETIVENVSSIVMGKSLAEKLVDAVQGMLETEEHEE